MLRFSGALCPKLWEIAETPLGLGFERFWYELAHVYVVELASARYNGFLQTHLCAQFLFQCLDRAR